jgi:hypothetical protein
VTVSGNERCCGNVPHDWRPAKIKLSVCSIGREYMNIRSTQYACAAMAFQQIDASDVRATLTSRLKDHELCTACQKRISMPLRWIDTLPGSACEPS